MNLLGSLYFLLFTTLTCQNFILASSLEEGELWNKACTYADNLKNPKIKCYKNEMILYLDDTNPNEGNTWDKARQLCSQKFYGSPYADLVSLELPNSQSNIGEFLKGNQNENIGFYTNGVCCLKKRDRESATAKECKWLSGGGDIIKELADAPDLTSCKVLKITSITGSIPAHVYEEKSSVSNVSPILCLFKYPNENVVPTTPTEATKPTEQTKPTEPTKTTVSDVTTKKTSSEATSHTTSNKPTKPTTQPTHPTTTISTTTDPTKICEKKEYCTTNNHCFQFDSVYAGQYSEAKCPQDFEGKARWFCTKEEKFDVKGPIIECHKEWTNEVKKELDKIKTKDDCLKFSEKLSNNYTENNMEFYYELSKVMEIVQDLRFLYEKFSRENETLPESQIYTMHMTKACSNLLDYKDAWHNARDESKTSLALDVFHEVQYAAAKMSCKNEPSHPQEIHEGNIALKTYKFSENQTVLDDFEFSTKKHDSSITISNVDLNDIDSNPECDQSTGVGTIFSRIGNYLSSSLKSDFNINSYVVGFSFSNKTVEHTPLKNGSVKIRLEHKEKLQFGDVASCSYWDYSASDWLDHGCEMDIFESNSKETVCICNHLTNFAALMDVSGREQNTTAKNILTIICCAFSIVGLCLTIGFLSFVRALRNRRSTITCNLSFCLLIVNILVLFGMDQTDYPILCKCISGLLLYSLLCSFSWTLMEGYHLYQMIVLVFSNIGHLRLIWVYLIGYGAPLVIFVFILLAITPSGLQGDYFCWISSSKYPYRVWALAGPATLVLIINFIIMIIALKTALEHKGKKQNTQAFATNSALQTNIEEKLSWLKGFISLVAVLGLTWIFYLLYIHEFGFVFSYLFIILNGLQGLFIFIFQILLNDKARSVASKAYNRRKLSQYFTSYKTSSTKAPFTMSLRSRSISTGVTKLNGNSNSVSNGIVNGGFIHLEESRSNSSNPSSTSNF